MVLSNEQVAEFQKIYTSYFGKDISKEEAYEKGIKLLRLMLLIYKPITEKNFNAIQEQRKEMVKILLKEFALHDSKGKV